jgi:hypothetical protein
MSVMARNVTRVGDEVRQQLRDHVMWPVRRVTKPPHNWRGLGERYRAHPMMSNAHQTSRCGRPLA